VVVNMKTGDMRLIPVQDLKPEHQLNTIRVIKNGIRSFTKLPKGSFVFL